MLVSGKGLLGWKRPKIQAVSVGSALFLQTTFFMESCLGNLPLNSGCGPLLPNE